MAVHQVSKMSLEYRMLVMDLVHEESKNTSILVTDSGVNKITHKYYVITNQGVLNCSQQSTEDMCNAGRYH